MVNSLSVETTAYVETAVELGRQVREAAVDHASFEQSLRPCKLSECRAACCHDGVMLSDEEAGRMKQLIGEHKDHFSACGIDPAAALLVFDEPKGAWRTAVRESMPEERAADFPDHFPRTRCVFLDDAHRCGWQRLSMHLEKPPWFHKPTGCWMHPLTVKRREGRPLIKLPSAGDDPHQRQGYPGFASCTPCGAACDSGQPALEVLSAELRMLSEISGRDLLAELNAPSADFTSQIGDKEKDSP